MNNSELDSILKKARRPEPIEEFWEEFPKQVVRRLNRARVEEPRLNTRWVPRLAWGMAIVVCITAAFAIGHWRGRVDTESVASNDILQNTKFVRETLALFPNQVRAIVRDQHGFNLDLASTSDVPTSTPIYVSVCDGKNCSSCVTFSGQEVQVAGQKLTVLSDGLGGIILMGDHFIWSSNRRVAMGNSLKIEAKNLSSITL